ncbi:MAG: hypothetical protein Q9164_003041 [Protoblastenia rupestris]
MAEAAKRPNNANAAGKAPIAATPNTSSQGTVSMEQALTTSIGARIRIQTTNNQTLEGTLFTACPTTSLLALSTGPASQQIHHIISLSSLTSFTILALPSSTSQLRAPLTPVNTTALQSRANAALAKAKERAAKINRGVARDAQDVFDALDKQFSARWRAKDIIVMERVVVRGPGYRGDDCRVITKDGEGLLGRVKKVLEHERRRAALRETKGAIKHPVPNIVPAVPAPQGPRKGG